MLLLPPLLAFLLSALILREPTRPLRGALLSAAVAWGALIVATSELLSIFHLLTMAGLLAAWALIDAVLALVLIARWQRVGPATFSRAPGAPYTTDERWMLFCIAAVVLIVGFIAVVAAPNTWDAMESHLPRAFFWAQNRTVAFYPSPHFLQNIATPFAQFAIAQSFILLGNDRAANCMQFVGMIGSMVTASLIARQFGGPRGAQILAALVCVTIPQGILEASGAQNTYIGAFWVAAAVYFLLRVEDEPGWTNLLSFGGAVGLALLTKGTAYTLLPPILLALWLAAPRVSKLVLLRAAPVLALVVVVLNAGFYLRNYALTGLPLGVPFPEAGQLAGGYANASYTIAGTAANVLRNISLHLAMPWSDKIIEPIFIAAMHAIGQDPDDPTHTWPEMGFRWPHLSLHEILAGNPLHLLLVVVSIVLLFARTGKETPRKLFFAIGLVGSFVMFCAMLRYTIFSSRYHLPLFVLAAPLTAVVLWQRVGARLSYFVGLVLFVTALPFLVGNRIRSLVPGAAANIIERPRSDIYFADSHLDAAQDFQRAVASLDDNLCREIGILASLRSPESTLVFSPPAFYVYPVLALLHSHDPQRHIAYVGVHNSSARYRMPDTFRPCAIICLDCARDPAIGAEFGLKRRKVFGDTVVLTASGD